MQDREGLDRILDAVEALLIESGYASISMRQIAAKAGVSLGTVSYFGPREALISRVVARTISSYRSTLEQLAASASGDPRRFFFEVVSYLVEDVSSSRTSALFPELWALTRHDQSAAASLSGLYSAEREGLEFLLILGWPELTETKVEIIIGGLIPLIEGMTIFTRGVIPLYERHSPAALVKAWLNCILSE